ncbi:MAG: DNA polymerase IV [Verrucomicrobiota bacterium]
MEGDRGVVQLPSSRCNSLNPLPIKAVFRVIFHLDMDAFYASVEQRDHPELKGQPVIVGAPPDRRGVVCAASYEARKFGVRSAMPSATAKRLCPAGLFVRPRMDAYQEESRRIMGVVAETGAAIEQVSIDEAYLDLSGACQRADADASLYAAVPLARALKNRIYAERQLTTSVGIAANKMLAKLASDFNKPNGLTLIPERDKVLFLRPMRAGAIHGVGKVTEQVLNRAGIVTIGDLQDYRGDLRALVGSFAAKLKAFAFGDDDRPLELGDEVKSISSENTFQRDTDDRKILRACLKEQAAEIAEKLKRRRLGAVTVQVKVRYSDFTTLTRQVTVEEPLTEAAEIYRLGCHLLGREKLVSRPLRLLGLGVSGLSELSNRQLVLALG